MPVSLSSSAACQESDPLFQPGAGSVWLWCHGGAEQSSPLIPAREQRRTPWPGVPHPAPSCPEAFLPVPVPHVGVWDQRAAAQAQLLLGALLRWGGLCWLPMDICAGRGGVICALWDGTIPALPSSQEVPAPLQQLCP